MVIEAAYGLGEVVVGGQVEPDTYVVSKDGPRIVQVHIGTKAEKIVRGPDGHDQRLPVPADEQGAGSWTTRRCWTWPAWAWRSNGTTAHPRTSEFAIEGGRTWIVQSRPITTLGDAARTSQAPRRRDPCSSPAWPPRPASPPDRCASCAAGRGRPPGQGRGARAPMTNPDWVPTMRRAAALVTDGGGVTCHAAIVGRELHLPTIVATRNATSVLRDGEIVTVDGATGEVRAGGAGRRLPHHARDRGLPHGTRRRGRPRPQRPPAPCSTSTSRSPTTPRRWPRCPSTGSACCAPSS